MQIWPAIDLRGGRCVRLIQGDYNRETVYGEDPVRMAAQWAAEGAKFLHIVDLDGARNGHPVNGEAINAIVRDTNLVCEVGGGVRDEITIEQLLEIGVSRVIVGTEALKNPDWFGAMCGKYPDTLVLGIDAKEGLVATDGWLEVSDCSATALASQFQDMPLAAVIYTDIGTDGMLAGPNFAAIGQMQEVFRGPVIASGGICSEGDIRQLAEIPVAGCIVGKALYEGRLSMAAALAAASKSDYIKEKN